MLREKMVLGIFRKVLSFETLKWQNSCNVQKNADFILLVFPVRKSNFDLNEFGEIFLFSHFFHSYENQFCIHFSKAADCISKLWLFYLN